jgi:hypothetical protein
MIGYPVLYLAPLGFIFDLVGYLPPYLRLLVVYGFLVLPICLRPSRRSIWGAVVLAAVMGIQATVTLPAVAEIGLLVIAHQWIWKRVLQVPSAVTAGVCCYTFLHYYLFLSPLGYPVLEGISRASCRISGWITGGSLNLGPTYQNIGGLLLFLCLSIFSWNRNRISIARTACFLGVVLLLGGLLSLVLVRRVDFGVSLVWELKYRDAFGYGQLLEKARGLAVVMYPALIFAAWLVVYVTLHYEAWKEQPTLVSEGNGKWDGWRWLSEHPWQGGLPIVALIFILVSMPPTAWRRPSARRLVFVERGVVSFTKPDYTRFGQAAGGMYGLLPEYVGLFGCTAEVVRDVPESLASDQVVVLTNLDEPLRPEVFRRLWAFVEAGGSLWVLGDHTFIKNGRNHINDLLAPCHISLNHDSAQFFPQGWFHSYEFRQGTPFGGLRDSAENRPAILVGASLRLRAPAQPFILGRYGYSDWGTSGADESRGYIGDFKYQSQERLGDLVLVAGERYGLGKVLVFGDTTSFFNNNLSRSYEILRSVLSWFGESPRWHVVAGWTGRVVAATVLVALGLLLLVFKNIRAVQLVLPASMLLSLAIHQPAGLLAYDVNSTRRRMAIIDFSHEPFASKHSSMNSGLHGVSINLARHGQLPVVINEWNPQLLDAAGLIVANAPRRPFSKSERRDLTRFMERGGTVLLGCGYPHYAFSRSFLETQRLGIRGLPLGRFFDRTAFGQRISFVSAWPIEMTNPEASVICLYDEWPLIVMAPVGRGRLVLISDSEFLHNRNLEGHENYDSANIQFMRSLLDYTMGGQSQ